MRRNVVVIALALVVVGVVGGCADAEFAATPGTSVLSSSPSSASTSASVDDADSPTPVSYDDGMIMLATPPADYRPTVSQAQAVAAVADTHLYDDLARFLPREVFLAMMTSSERSNRVDEHGDLVPNDVDHPVWVVRYANVQSVGSGTGSLDDPTTQPAPILQDAVALVDAKSAKVLMALNGARDSA